VTKTVKQEGPLAFYKGTLSPLAGIAFCVSIQFAALGQMKRTFAKWNGSGDLTPLQFYLSGGVAGVANSLVSGPVEHIRTRMQVQTSGQPAQYSSTVDCFRKIAGQYGMRGVYKGQVITMLREWQGYGGYFFAYEWLAQQAMKRRGADDGGKLPTWQVMCFGAAAGYAMWIPVFPLVRYAFAQ
jgi:solute carrier family 25 carnitine/acylcarnitine transporter 20/29